MPWKKGCRLFKNSAWSCFTSVELINVVGGEKAEVGAARPRKRLPAPICEHASWTTTGLLLVTWKYAYENTDEATWIVAGLLGVRETNDNGLTEGVAVELGVYVFDGVTAMVLHDKVKVAEGSEEFTRRKYDPPGLRNPTVDRSTEITLTEPPYVADEVTFTTDRVPEATGQRTVFVPGIVPS
jgi:hypothetical protein